MNKLIALLALFSFTSSAFGGSSTVVEATNTEGFFSSQNLVRDPGFEGQNKGGAWTKSGGTLTISSTNPGRGGYMGVWASSASAQTLKSKLTAIPSGLQGRNGVVSCLFKAGSGTATHTLTASDGTNDLATATTINSSTTQFQRTSVNFIFPSSGSVQLKLSSVSASEPSLSIDDCYLGTADGFNLGSVSQATFVGSIKWAPTASCTWATNNVSWGNFSNVSACAGTARTILGNVTDASVGLRPAVGIPNAGPGRYVFVAHAGFYKNNTSNTRCDYRFYDGTNASNAGSVSSNSAESQDPAFSGALSYATAPGTITVDIQGFAATVANCDLDASNVGLEIEVYRYPTTSETVYRADQNGGSWAGYHDNTCSWARTSTSYGDPATDATCNLVQRSNTNFGSVTSATGTLPGITLTPTKAGNYQVCYVAQTFVGTATAQIGVALTDGVTIFREDGQQFSSTGDVRQLGGCAIVPISSAGSPVTLKLQTRANSGAVTIGESAYGNAIEWTISPATVTLPAPVFVGSVTSGSAGAERIARAKFGGASEGSNCTGSCTIFRGDSGISSVTRSSTGVYSINFPAGLFSSPPDCSGEGFSWGTSYSNCREIASPTTTTASLSCYNTASSATIDSEVVVRCAGPR